VNPFECYKIYLSIKNHFTKDSYDYHKYCGKSRATIQSFYKRKDRFWFEKISRQKSEKEILDFFVSNFVSCSDPQSLWIGEIIREGESNYKNWCKKIQSLSYIFKEEINLVFSNKNFDKLFEIEEGRHPQLLKDHLQGKISLESMIILDRILGYKKEFDQKLQDPIWTFVSMKITKYSSFLHTDVFKFKKILKECVL
jgi:hypothetical protein